MLATLERPTARPVITPSITRTAAAPVCSPPPPPPASARLRLVAPLPACPAAVQAAARSVRAGPVSHSARAMPLRTTVRARRLLAGLALLSCAAVGAVAVDVVSALAPFPTSTSYAAQESPYVGSGDAVGAGGLVPAGETSIIVGAGDTLWSLAEQVDPDSDPRDLIAAIMTLNDLDSPTIVPGQVLELP